MPLYAISIFLSAFLLFAVQPIIARILLPWFGGSAAVWTVCMLFFQTGLLLGYFHGHWTHRALTPRNRALLHAGLLLVSLLFLPILPDPSWRPSGGEAPTLRLLGLLARCVGLPYVLLSSTGPLFQDWFAARYPGRDPYRLFSFSNLASLLALLSYPFLVEPMLSVSAQSRWWSWGYRAFVVLGVLVALDSLRAPVPAAQTAQTAIGTNDPGESPAPTRGLRLLWLLLPACTTTLLLAVTNYLIEDVAALPLLFLLPLCLYLLTFIFSFARRSLYHRAVFIPLFIVAMPALGWLRTTAGDLDLQWTITLGAIGLFVACMVLHGELSRLRPPPRSLTQYYLYISLGGALGGLIVGVVAPLVLPGTFEFEGGIGAAAVLLLAVLYRDEKMRRMLARRRFIRPLVRPVALVWCAGLAAFLVRNSIDQVRGAHLVVRNFYGVKTISDTGPVDEKNAVRKLLHGAINHGSQWRDPARAAEPLTYYCPDSGVGRALTHHFPDRPRTLGFIGLGTGTLTSYGKPGDKILVYDIDPLVFKLAREQFTYLAKARGNVEVILGDARLSLEARPPEGFDVLAVDAFSGDAIPVHLLTREAVALYLRHLRPDGVLAVHISNRHINLRPVVADAADALGRVALVIESEDSPDDDGFCYESEWVLLVPPDQAENEAWKGATRLVPRRGFRGWTDDYSNLIEVFK